MSMYAVGDEVGYVRYYMGTIMQQGISRVIKVNHHGHMILENGRQFDRWGAERKVSHGGCRLINADELRAQIAQVAADRMRAQAAQELIQLVQGQRDGYGRQHEANDQTRARMLDLVNQL